MLKLTKKFTIFSFVIAVLAISGLLTVDNASAIGSGSYVRFLNKIHVYDVINNQFRYVSYDEAMRDNIWSQVRGDIPQSSVLLTGKEDCRVFANLSQWGKGSEVWVQNEGVFGEIGFSWSAVQWRVQVPSANTYSASGVTVNSAALSGSANSNGGSNTDVWFDYGVTSGMGQTASASSISGSGSRNISANISNLTDNTTYYYRAAARNCRGTTFGSTSTFRTQNVSTPPQQDQGSVPAVSTGSASNISTNGATLNGYANPNNASTAAYFQYGMTNSFGSTSSSYNVGSGNSQSSYSMSVSGLSDNTTYYFRAVANNNFGTVYGNILSFTTTASQQQGGAPTVSTSSVTNASISSATFNALVNPNGAFTNSWFDYGTSASFGSTTPAFNFGSGSSSANFYANVSNLSPNTTYYYRVSASNNFGTSRGNVLSFTTTQAVAATTDLSGISYALAQISVSLNNLISQLRNSNVNNTYNVVNTVLGDTALLTFTGDKTKMSREEDVVFTAVISHKTTLNNAVLEVNLDKDFVFEGTSSATFTKSGNVITFNLGRIPANNQQSYTVTAKVSKDFTNTESKKDKFISTATFSYSDSNGRNPNSVTASVSVDFNQNTGFFASIISFFSGWNLGIIILFLVLLLIIGAAILLK